MLNPNANAAVRLGNLQRSVGTGRHDLQPGPWYHWVPFQWQLRFRETPWHIFSQLVSNPRFTIMATKQTILYWDEFIGTTTEKYSTSVFLQPTKGGFLHTRIYNQSSSCRRMPWPSDQDARNSHDGWDDPGLHRDCLRNHWSFLIDAFVKHSSELHRCMLDHQSPWLPARSALNWPNFWCASKALPSQPPSTSPRARSSCPAGVALGAGGQSDL